MPARRKNTATASPAKTLEVQLWDAANKMRGAEDVEDDGEAFEEKMPRLAAALRERFAKRTVLEKQVNANLEGMGYGG